MSIQETDITGQAPSERDVDDAIQAIRNQVVGMGMLKLPPELAVNLPNILRCLQHYKAHRRPEGGARA